MKKTTTETEKTTGDPSMNIKRFMLKAAIAIAILAGALSFKMQKDFILGVIMGGALAMINLKEMHKGLKDILYVESPSPRKLLFTAVVRLMILATVITVIGMLKLVNLLGLLVGFGVVPLLLLGEGLLYARSLQSTAEVSPRACCRKDRP